MYTNSEKKKYLPLILPGIYLYQSYSRRYIQHVIMYYYMYNYYIWLFIYFKELAYVMGWASD